jgi:hypothetical protein
VRKHILFPVIFLVSVTLFLMQPAGALPLGPLFGTAVNYNAHTSPYSVTSSDFDGDGDIDLAVANVDSDDVSILLGNGDGTFIAAVNYSVGTYPWSVATGDLDGDGDSDLAVANYQSARISVFLGDGEGNFDSPIHYMVGGAPTSVTCGDFDGDGDIDLAVAIEEYDTVKILLGNGDGSFTSAGNFGVGNAPSSVTSNDLDGDGVIDLAVANADSDSVSVLLGNGDGTFASAVNYDVGDAPSSVIGSDFDGDGDCDLAVANELSDNVSILLGNGDGTFASAVNFSVGDAPRSVNSNDFDGDGDNDLAVANSGSDNVSILLNLSDRPPLPIISSITDIPNDQGKQVRLTWSRCGADRVGSSITITEYVIYRKIDYYLSASFRTDIERAPERLDQERESGTVLLYPPGDWDCLMNIPACAETVYSTVVPTLADSTIAKGIYYSTFFVRALTTTLGAYYDSAPDSGYSVDNLAPGVPTGFAVAYNTGIGNQLAWDPSPDPDFQYYRIYRGETEDFVPAPGNLVHETATENWADPEYDGWDVYYKITALDYAGNESDAASPESTTGDDVTSVPKVFALCQNVPNPFNPTTTIRFDLPRPTHVKLCVYDVKGELITTLVDQHMTEGPKEVAWTATSDQGNTVASGIYFYRLVAGDFVQTRKMALLR